MRKIIFHWIMRVSQKFKLQNKTLFLAFKLFDSFSQNNNLTSNDHQLVGLTCLFISCKLEEVYYPSLDRFLAICEMKITKNDIIAKETEILVSQSYQIMKVTVVDQLELIVQQFSL